MFFLIPLPEFSRFLSISVPKFFQPLDDEMSEQGSEEANILNGAEDALFSFEMVV